MYNVARIHYKNFQNTTRYDNQHQALEHIGLTLPVFLREKEEREKYRLDNSKKNENGKKVDAIGQENLRF
jgi:hypothetical protein